MKLNFKQINATNDVLFRLVILKRWTWKINNRCLNELSKQALNCIATYMLACICEHEGETVKWENFPKIALYRAYQKAHVYFDIPEYVLKEICQIGDMAMEDFEKVTQQIIAEKTDQEFADFISSANESFEAQIYRAATKIATFVELVENKYKLHDMEQKQQDLDKNIRVFSLSIPGVEEMANVEGEYFKVLLDIAHLRNQTRWAVMPTAVKCNVLGHLFDTAVFAYLMSLEQYPDDEKRAAKMFFMGIFHDVAETWTKDIPSPIKDKIPGFREITEKYEMKVVEDNIYKKLPDFMSDRIREVMFEDESNKESGVKPLIKGADYLAGDVECWRQYVAGSRDDYFKGAIDRRVPDIRSGKVILTPECKLLYKKFKNFATRCISLLYDEDEI